MLNRNEFPRDFYLIRWVSLVFVGHGVAKYHPQAQPEHL